MSFFSGRRALAHFLLDTFLDFNLRFCISNQLQMYLFLPTMDSVNMNVSMFSFANVPKICPFFSGRRALAHFLLDTN